MFHSETAWVFCLLLFKKCPYLNIFWSVFSRIRTEYGEIRIVLLYSLQMPENTDQENSKYGHFSRIVCVFLSDPTFILLCWILQACCWSLHCTKKWNFPLRISSVNVTKSAGNSGFGHIYWINPIWKTSFFCAAFEKVNGLTRTNNINISPSRFRATFF